MLVIQVFIMRNGAFEGTEMVTGDRIEVGRDPSCALALEDEGCSRKHAAIFEQNGALIVQDLGSQNGTRVNGELLTGPRAIGPRDDIAIGAFMLKLKVMSGIGRAAPVPAPAPVGVNDPTRVAHRPHQATPAPILVGKNVVQEPQPPSHEAKATAIHHRPSSVPAGVVAGNRIGIGDVGPTEILSPIGRSEDGVGDSTVTHTRPNPPPMPPVSDPSFEAPTIAARGLDRGAAEQSSKSQPSPRSPRPSSQPSAPSFAGAPQPMHAQHQGDHHPDVTAPESAQLPRAAARAAAVPMEDFPIGLGPLPDGADVPSIAFAPQFLPEEMAEDDADDPPWSLVQRLVRPTTEKQKSALVEVVHYRGENVVDHTVLKEGETFRLGASMTRAERQERGIVKIIPLVRLKKGGVAEIFIKDDVTGKLLRGGQQQDLMSSPGMKGQQAVPITDGELASLKVGGERVFVRFAGAPQLMWTREDAAEDLFARKMNLISGGASGGLFALMLLASWIYQFRNADEEIIALEDEGFADVELKELKMEEPPPEEKPEPIQAAEETPPDTKPQSQKQDTKPQPTEPTPKPGVMDILNNIPKVQDSASSQNLTAALSNIKGVRVPGATAGFKTSSLVGKGPSSGVQIGGAAGGLSTSGINSVLREGSAGALGGKETRAVSGKVTTLSRQFKKEGQGELSKEEIMRVINANIGKIQYCYEKSLRTQPGLSGRVVLEWTVNTSGKVTVVKVASSSMNSNDATRCMMDSLRGWKFPQPKGGNVTIVFPFVFNTV